MTALLDKARLSTALWWEHITEHGCAHDVCPTEAYLWTLDLIANERLWNAREGRV